MKSYENLRQGALQEAKTSLFWKRAYDFLLVFRYNCVLIMHRFVNIKVLLLTGNDVIEKSHLGGVAGKFWLQILKERT